MVKVMGAVSPASSHGNLHVFVDTNIFLSFFHFAKSDLDALRKVFASHDNGIATVYLTQQVRDEIDKNRESRLKDAMKRFRDARLSVKSPSFVQNYAEAQQLRELLRELAKTRGRLLDKVEADIRNRDLLADRLLTDIFANSTIPRDRRIDNMAIERMHVGNPPGKPGSAGDAINWLTLLREVPCEEDVHIVSEDGDFFSSFDKEAPHPFLSNEWEKTKTSSLYVYRGLEPFMKRHFDGTDLP